MMCPHCHLELEEGRNTCSHCGFVLSSSSPAKDWSQGVLQARQRSGQTGRRVGYVQNGTKKHSLQNTPLPADLQYQANEQRPPLRATRFTTDPFLQNEVQRQNSAWQDLAVPSPASNASESFSKSTDVPLLPNALIGEGRYRLTDRRSVQKWSSNAYEAYWYARDLLEGMKNVLICEMSLFGIKVSERQMCLRTAMRTLFSASAQAHIPPLINVFREGGRDFFVFAVVEGESLLGRLQRTRLPEQEISQCCLKITETLEAIVRYDTPIVHGRINPENVFYSSDGRWMLSDFSVVLASGAQRYFQDIDPSALSPFTPPDLTLAQIDPRLDLYSLLATAYYAVTGNIPKESVGGAPRGQQIYAFVSPPFGAILLKGLRPLANQRYQHPSELRQNLLTLHPSIDKSISIDEEDRDRAMLLEVSQREPIQPFKPVIAGGLDPVAQVFSSLSFPDEEEKATKDLLPRPEELPPFPKRNDALAATLWMVGMLLCLLLPIILK